ncbi:hypothetical protein JTE90_001585 [Oedothorax gibbosus]|uniref:Cytokine-inducible SH2-containing protein n=1 Tax=Oedothorax gibbosus TaxID=931172 RepID=A0AAV6VPH8_9ARAC|nr:hypothetical protein JTE90_001585 [Oedothorax gibbosus]
MLISHPPLDSFNNPVDSLLTLPATEDVRCTTPPTDQGWAPSGVQREEPIVRTENDFRTDSTDASEAARSSLEELLLRQLKDFCLSHQKQLNPREDVHDQRQNLQQQNKSLQKDKHQQKQVSVQDKHSLLLQQLRDFCLNHQKQSLHQDKKQQQKGKHRLKVERTFPAAMSIEPEDDLRCLVDNVRSLELCGYYYGNLSWLDASTLLRRCQVGTFLVRDSEHHGYLYTLSVQTRKGPTSCRIDYSGGKFKLDSSKDLSHKMPRFDCVTDLIDFYVQLPKYLCSRAVWLDEDSRYDVPVQIYRPLYKAVRSLQHLCRVAVARGIADTRVVADPASSTPAQVLNRTLERDSRYSGLPGIIKDYLRGYPYTQ